MKDRLWKLARKTDGKAALKASNAPRHERDVKEEDLPKLAEWEQLREFR